jgi:hypothetical protein
MAGLLRDFAAAEDDAARKRLAADIQVEASQAIPRGLTGCCARAANGQAIAVLPRAKKSRRFNRSPHR